MRPAVLLRSGLATFILLWWPAVLSAEIVAIHAKTYNGYSRQQSPDGQFATEFYTFGEGGCWSRAIKDPWMEKLQFLDVARVVAQPLAEANYRPGAKVEDTKLLILVYWGSTQGSTDFSPNDTINQASQAVAAYNREQDKDMHLTGNQDRLENRKAVNARTPEGAAYESFLWQLGNSNRMRDELDERNARILGYGEALDRARFAVQLGTSRDIRAELGGNRYYVVLQAYDFQVATQQKKLVPLWTTRLSIAEKSDFGAALTQLAASGKRYFGRDTDGLKRLREASVNLAPLKIIEENPGQPKESTATKP